MLKVYSLLAMIVFSISVSGQWKSAAKSKGYNGLPGWAAASRLVSGMRSPIVQDGTKSLDKEDAAEPLLMLPSTSENDAQTFNSILDVQPHSAMPSASENDAQTFNSIPDVQPHSAKLSASETVAQTFHSYPAASKTDAQPLSAASESAGGQFDEMRSVVGQVVGMNSAAGQFAGMHFPLEASAGQFGGINFSFKATDRQFDVLRFPLKATAGHFGGMNSVSGQFGKEAAAQPLLMLPSPSETDAQTFNSMPVAPPIRAKPSASKTVAQTFNSVPAASKKIAQSLREKPSAFEAGGVQSYGMRSVVEQVVGMNSAAEQFDEMHFSFKATDRQFDEMRFPLEETARYFGRMHLPFGVTAGNFDGMNSVFRQFDEIPSAPGEFGGVWSSAAGDVGKRSNAEAEAGLRYPERD